MVGFVWSAAVSHNYRHPAHSIPHRPAHHYFEPYFILIRFDKLVFALQQFNTNYLK